MGGSGGGSVGSGSGGAGKPGIREFGERVVGARTDGNSPFMVKRKKVLFRNEKRVVCCFCFFSSGKCRWGIIQFRSSLGLDFFKELQVPVVSVEYLTSLDCVGQEFSITFKERR